MLTHTVRKGDSLWQIAKAHNISLDALIAANPQIADPNYVLPGTIIHIPVLVTPDSSCFPHPPEEQPRPLIYSSQAGEQLTDIARRFHLPINRLLFFNLNHAKQESLPEGTRIIIPSESAVTFDIPLRLIKKNNTKPLPR